MIISQKHSRSRKPFAGRRRNSGTFTHAIEPLESRQLFSTLNLPLSLAEHSLTLRVDPASPAALQVLSGTSLIRTVPFTSFSAVLVTSTSAASNTLTVDYADGFFDQPVTFNGGAETTASALTVIDDGSSGAREWNVSSTSFTALGTGKPANPTVSFSAIQNVSLSGRSSGGETFLDQKTAHGASILPTSTSLTIASADAVNIQGTDDPLTLKGTVGSTGERIAIGSVAPYTGGMLPAIGGSINLTAINSHSTLLVDDSADAANRTSILSPTALTGFGLPASVTISYPNTLASLTARAGGGANTETVTGTSVPTTLFAGLYDPTTVNIRATSAPLTINGGLTDYNTTADIDTINIGSLSPAVGGVLTAINATITVTNTSSRSTLGLDDSGDTTSRDGTIATTSVTGFSMGAAVNYTGSQLASLTVRGPIGDMEDTNNETITGTSTPTTFYPGGLMPGYDAPQVTVLATTKPLTLNYNGFIAQTYLGGATNTLATLNGSISIINPPTGEGGLFINDSGDNSTRTDTMTATSLGGFGLPASTTIYYSQYLGELAVTTGNGANTVNVLNTPFSEGIFVSNYLAQLFLGTGDDTVNVRATQGFIVIHGAGDQDSVNIGSLAPNHGGTLKNVQGALLYSIGTLTLDDSGDKAAQTGTITDSEIVGFGLDTTVFSAVLYQCASLVVFGGSGANTDTVTGTSVPTTLYPSAPGAVGTTSVSVQSVSAALTLNGNGSVDDISIGSNAPGLGGTLGSIAAPITVTNTSFLSTLGLDDSGDTTTQFAALTSTSVTGLGMASGGEVDYIGSQLSSLTLRGGTAAFLFEVSESISPTLIDVVVI